MDNFFGENPFENEEETENKEFECPVCKSENVRFHFVDEYLNEMASNTDELTHQGTCKNCKHSDELTYFIK